MLRASGVLVLAALGLGSAAEAVVPPKDCGRMTVERKRYQVKADQVSCATGRRWAKAYIARQSKPAGYRCTTYPRRRNRVSFYCNDGRKVFFAIRR